MNLRASGATSLAACGDGGSTGGGPGPGPTPTPTPTPTPPPLSATQGSRFLAQAAIGYSKADINTVISSGINGWINNQFAMARPQKFWDFLVANGHDAAANVNTNNGFVDQLDGLRLTLSVEDAGLLDALGLLDLGPALTVGLRLGGGGEVADRGEGERRLGGL